MRVLVVHSWLKGNLGDVLQFSVLLSMLRELRPRVLDLAGFPAHPSAAAADVVAAADRFIPEPFPWYWTFTPSPVVAGMLRPMWKARRRALFARYDVIVCAPGPYFADYDPRVHSALCDIDVASELGKPVVLASHSIGPLTASGLGTIARAAVRIAREPSTHAYLGDRGISSVLSSDLAFLYPFHQRMGPSPLPPPYRVAFLRSNNLSASALRLDKGALYEGAKMIAPASGDPLVLATSDHRRDARYLAGVGRRLGVPFVSCQSVDALVRLVGGSSGVVTDRYHPAICAAVLGKPALVVANREPHKMGGLGTLLAQHPVAALQDLARAGVTAMWKAIHEA
jgi:polysaccharide pyruvyl transferase WcaK-like protein